MYQTLLLLHTSFRWLVLLSLLLAVYRAARGYFSALAFTRFDNALRHWTATIAHIQLLVGMVLYFHSPIVRYVLSRKDDANGLDEPRFFAWVHAGAMLAAIVMLTFGSALARRQTTDRARFKTMYYWFLAALVIILLAIPWPWSPFAQRPYLRLY